MLSQDEIIKKAVLLLAYWHLKMCKNIMQEAVELFIKYTELKAPTAQEQAESYKKLLLDIASGSWHFSNEFCAWRDSCECSSK